MFFDLFFVLITHTHKLNLIFLFLINFLYRVR